MTKFKECFCSCRKVSSEAPWYLVGGAWCPRCSRRSGPRLRSPWWSNEAASGGLGPSSAEPASVSLQNTCNTSRGRYTSVTHSARDKHVVSAKTDVWIVAPAAGLSAHRSSSTSERCCSRRRRAIKTLLFVFNHVNHVKHVELKVSCHVFKGSFNLMLGSAQRHVGELQKQKFF